MVSSHAFWPLLGLVSVLPMPLTTQMGASTRLSSTAKAFSLTSRKRKVLIPRIKYCSVSKKAIVCNLYVTFQCINTDSHKFVKIRGGPNRTTKNGKRTPKGVPEKPSYILLLAQHHPCITFFTALAICHPKTGGTAFPI